VPENHPLRPFAFATAGFLLGLAAWILLGRLLPANSVSDVSKLAGEVGMTSLSLREGYDKGQELRLYVLGTFLVPGGLWLGWFLSTRNRPGSRSRHSGDSTKANSSSYGSLLTHKLPWAIVALAALTTGLRPDVLHGANPWGNFGLLAEEGVYLGAIQALRTGRTLYAELHFPYGPMLLQPLQAWLSIFGDTIVAARAYVLFLHGVGVIGCALCIRLALGRASLAQWSAAAAAAAIALLAPTELPTLNSALLRPVFAFLPVSMLLAGLRWWRHLPPGPAPQTTPFVLAGGLAAIAILVSLEVGIAATLAVMMTLLFARTSPSCWLQTLAGFAVLLIIALVPLIVSGGLTAYVQQSAHTLTLSSLGYQAIPYPDALGLFVDSQGLRGTWPKEGLDPATALWSTMPPLLCWLAVGIGVAGTLGHATRKQGLPLLALGLCSSVLMLAALGRSDLYHLWFYGAVPTVLILTLLGARSWTLLSAQYRFAIPALAALSLAALITTQPMEQVRLQGAPVTNLASIEHPRTGPIQVDPATAAQIEALLNWSERLPADEEVWFYPSEAMFYFLTDRPLPTSFLWAYDAPSRAMQEQAIAELSKSAPLWLVRSELGFTIDWIPEEELLPQLSLYIQSNYETVGMLPGATLMRRLHR
jgi:hypothetical protein